MIRDIEDNGYFIENSTTRFQALLILEYKDFNHVMMSVLDILKLLLSVLFHILVEAKWYVPIITLTNVKVPMGVFLSFLLDYVYLEEIEGQDKE